MSHGYHEIMSYFPHDGGIESLMEASPIRSDVNDLQNSSYSGGASAACMAEQRARVFSPGAGNASSDAYFHTVLYVTPKALAIRCIPVCFISCLHLLMITLIVLAVLFVNGFRTESML